MSSLTVALVVRDEAEMLPGCLQRLGFADEVVVLVDDRTTDDTEEIARRHGALVSRHSFVDFAAAKNTALARATSDWCLILDADERVSAALADELLAAAAGDRAAYALPIRNVFQGRPMRAGGWTREAPVRLLPRGGGRYVGEVHEEMALGADVPLRRLRTPLVHFSHRTLIENVRKTERYAEAQATKRLRHDSSPVGSTTIVYAFFRELLRRAVYRRGYRDGVPGWLEAIHQAYVLAMVEGLVWERQQQPTIDEVYRTLDRDLR